MKKIESFFITAALFAVIIVTGTAIWHINPQTQSSESYDYPANKYGAFLAGQHAIYVNDFEKASEFSKKLKDRDLPIIQNTVVISDFLNGKMPDNVSTINKDSSAAPQLIYDAYLITQNDWKTIYKRHKNDESALAAPLRIWSGIANGKIDETFAFIKKLRTTESWKSFVRGQIYAETGKITEATKQFAKVSPDFMNINDYMYMIAFYNHNNMSEEATKLQKDFTERPGGMYMLDTKISPNWVDYSGYNNELSFNFVQSVSHTQILMYSDLSLLMLRFAEVIRTDSNANKDALNYYLGQYFFNNGGNYDKLFKSIGKNSPFYSFACMKIVEKTGKISDLQGAVRANPLFVPAITKLIAKNVQQGDKREALRVVNRALENKKLSEKGRAFFLKARASIYLTFDDIDSAQNDIQTASHILPMDADILAIQSKIWAIQKKELTTAYQYSIALVTKNPTQIESWDVLGMVVWAKEGASAALEIFEKVGQVAENCSSLFEHLGDLQLEMGNKNLARDAYLRAIDLSSDGLVSVPKLEKKIRMLK